MTKLNEERERNDGYRYLNKGACFAAAAAMPLMFLSPSVASATDNNSGWYQAFQGNDEGVPCVWLNASAHAPSQDAGYILDYWSGEFTPAWSSTYGCEETNGVPQGTGVDNFNNHGFYFVSGDLDETANAELNCDSLTVQQPPATWTNWANGDALNPDESSSCAHNVNWLDETEYYAVVQNAYYEVRTWFQADSCVDGNCNIPRSNAMNLKRLTFGAVGVAAAAITTVTVIHANSTHDSSVARSPIAVPETQGTGWVSTEDLTGVGLNVNQILHDMGPFPVYSSKAGGKVIAVYYRNGRGVQPLHGSYTDPGVKPMTSSSI